MKKEELQYISFKETNHRNQKVILCLFPYNPQLLKEFKANFPSAKWSRTHTAWYLPDSLLYRKRLNLPIPEIGDSWLNKFYAHNQAEFIKFRNALTQKAFSPSTIQTYLGEFAQLLILLKNYTVDTLTPDRLNAYFLYCIKTLKHSEAQIHSRMSRSEERRVGKECRERWGR